MEANQLKSWYQNSYIIIPSLILLPPVGLFLMWKYTQWTKTVKWILTIVVIFIILSKLSPTSPRTQRANKDISPFLPTPTVISEEYKESLAQTFCDQRSNGTPYFDLQAVADYANGKSDGNETVYNTTAKPLIENCLATANFCLNLWEKEDCENIANKKIWIGMTYLQLDLSWGNPQDINNTVNSVGVHSQRVYNDFGPYVYLEGSSKDNLKVISWQD